MGFISSLLFCLNWWMLLFRVGLGYFGSSSCWSVAELISVITYSEIFLLSAAMMSRSCSGMAGTWGNLLDTVLWGVECGGSSGIQPIKAYFWLHACTTTSKSLTAKQHLVRMMRLILIFFYGLISNESRKWFLKVYAPCKILLNIGVFYYLS